MQTGGEKIMRCEGVHACRRSSNFIFPSVLVFPSLYVNTALTLSVELHPLLSLLWLSFCHCTFFSCLPSPRAVSPSPFPPLPSLPLFSLTLKSSHSLCFLSFTASTCWQEEKEEDAALAPQCCCATSPVSADCL